MRVRIVSIAILSVVTSLAPARASVLVVDLAGGAGTFQDLQSAVNAAVDGDILLVRPGDYTAVFGLGPIAIDGKSLTIVADPAGSSVLAPGFSVINLAATETVVIRGIDCAGGYPAIPFLTIGFEAVNTTNCLGAVLVEDCDLVGGVGGAIFNFGFPGYPAARASNSKLTLVRCSLHGGAGYPGSQPAPAGSGGPGAVSIANASLALFECTVLGHSPATLVAAGAGIYVAGSKLMLSGSSVHGGNATPGCGSCAGGDGIHADASSVVRWIDSTFEAGAGAFSPLPIDAPPGVESSWPGQARSWKLASPVVEFQPVSVAIEGLQGDSVLFFWSPLGAHFPIGGLKAWLVLGSPLVGPFAIATITSPSGLLAFTANAPALVPASIDGFTFQMQPVFASGAEAVAGAPSALTLLR